MVQRIVCPLLIRAIKQKMDYILIGGCQSKTMGNFAEKVVQKPEWIQDQRFNDKRITTQNVDELEIEIENVLEEQDPHIGLIYWTNMVFLLAQFIRMTKHLMSLIF